MDLIWTPRGKVSCREEVDWDWPFLGGLANRKHFIFIKPLHGKPVQGLVSTAFEKKHFLSFWTFEGLICRPDLFWTFEGLISRPDLFWTFEGLISRPDLFWTFEGLISRPGLSCLFSLASLFIFVQVFFGLMSFAETFQSNTNRPNKGFAQDPFIVLFVLDWNVSVKDIKPKSNLAPSFWAGFAWSQIGNLTAAQINSMIFLNQNLETHWDIFLFFFRQGMFESPSDPTTHPLTSSFSSPHMQSNVLRVSWRRIKTHPMNTQKHLT